MSKAIRVTPLAVFLGFTAAVFIGILVFVWVVSKQTTVVMLDENGSPARTSAAR